MDRLQRIGRGRLANLTPFGRESRSYCGSSAMLAHMPDHGFLDGGCLSLALAVRKWLGAGVEVRFCAGSGRLQHAVAEVVVGGRLLYLDGDGLATKADLAAKMTLLESTPGIELIDATIDQAAAAGIVDDGRSDALAAALAERFGSEPPTEAWLAGPDDVQTASAGPAP